MQQREKFSNVDAAFLQGLSYNVEFNAQLFYFTIIRISTGVKYVPATLGMFRENAIVIVLWSM
jgi:hypothetical protein